MNGIITERTWRAIYRLLDRVSPVPYDCGTLCGARCCTCEDNPDGKDMGIYLYPGEHLIHMKDGDWLTWSKQKAEIYDFPDSWVGTVYFVNCKTPPVCPRKKRPFQCRTFPLKPYIDQEGTMSLLYDYDELPYSCPLIENRMEISSRFYRATYTVWAHLIKDPLIYDLVELESREWEAKNI